MIHGHLHFSGMNQREETAMLKADKFCWNVPLDQGSFKLSIPDDYELVQ